MFIKINMTKNSKMFSKKNLLVYYRISQNSIVLTLNLILSQKR